MDLHSIPLSLFRAEGILKNVNTIEEYKALDRAAIVERAGRTVSNVDGKHSVVKH